MSTHDRYVMPAGHSTWDVPMVGHARFSWEYDDGRARLLALYQKGKDKQWDAATRIDWSLEVNPFRALELPDETVPIHGLPVWEKLGRRERDELSQHLVAWQFSQFLHGEQGAMICGARIVESVPDMDAKFYAATQAIDEARHAETYARFLDEKIGMMYPINHELRSLLDSTLTDSRWDMPYLGMQVLIEGLALAAFGVLRDVTPAPLPKQILSYVMQDEARHVAFGRLVLRDYYAQLSSRERAEREEFVVESCWLMRNRLRAVEVWENLGFDVDECLAAVETSAYMRAFRKLLFSRIVPCVKDIGLWGEKVQETYERMGVLDLSTLDLAEIMKRDEDIADDLDRARAEDGELAVRRAQVAETIAAAG
ncbi:ferritin-like domain-containing protein [Frankia sp. Cppng1_Ct_nod]|uniref:ferritin-like domain-containing protein n=1 Tax=Frankia sp. Cppng1_Ct_nod TaxID=2897162 RepID=UPI002024150D|nr:ferritin-like domain-containing protein [Frankia sp. Cppng1_Ct_nod]